MEETTPDSSQTCSVAAPASWYREPLFHFLLIGLALFGVFALMKNGTDGDPRRQVSHRIRVSEDKLRELYKLFLQNEGHAPSSNELNKKAEEWVKEELLYREGMANGLDRNDPVIRQRLVKLMQWYMIGASGGGEPTEKEMRDHFEANQERYRVGAGNLAFEQIFFSTIRRGATAESDARLVWQSFQAGTQTAQEVALGHGDSMGSPDRTTEVTQRGEPAALATTFGKPFVDSLLKMPFDKWAMPVQSPMGWHVVRRLKPSNPTFEELKHQIRSELIAARGNSSPDQAYAELLKRYDVEIGDLPEVRK
jgi:hypothetical protein